MAIPWLRYDNGVWFDHVAVSRAEYNTLKDTARNATESLKREQDKRAAIAGDLMTTQARLEVITAQRDYLREEIDRLAGEVDLPDNCGSTYAAEVVVNATIKALDSGLVMSRRLGMLKAAAAIV